jgi:hypothetical protein
MELPADLERYRVKAAGPCPGCQRQVSHVLARVDESGGLLLAFLHDGDERGSVPCLAFAPREAVEREVIRNMPPAAGIH